MKSVDICIFVHNQLASTLRLFKTLFKYTPVYNKIIVVDNCSTDNTQEELKRYLDKIEVITNDKNLGFAGGNNLVMKNSKADYVCLLNNDTEMFPDWLEKLVNVAESDEKIGLVSPLNRTREKLIIGGKLLTNYKGILLYLENKDNEVDWLQASCLLIKSKVIQTVGLFDEIFDMGYYEDVDFCLRVKEAGFKLVWTPDVIINHYEGVTSKSLNLKEKFMEINRKKFMEKWGKK